MGRLRRGSSRERPRITKEIPGLLTNSCNTCGKYLGSPRRKYSWRMAQVFQQRRVIVNKVILAPLAIYCKRTFFAAANPLDCVQVHRPPFARLLPFHSFNVLVGSDCTQIDKDLLGLLYKVLVEGPRTSLI